MTKKNILTAAVSLSLVACLSIGATLAYFTDTDSKVNAFTTGKVGMTLTDDSPAVNGWKTGSVSDTGVTYEGVMPGDKLSKDVYITMDSDSADAYVAVVVKVEGGKNGTPSQKEVFDLAETAMSKTGFLNSATEQILLGDEENPEGCVYLLNWTAKGGDVIDIMDVVEIPPEWGNAYTKADFSISVTAYAAQAENLDKNDFFHMAYEQTTDPDASYFEEYTKG